MYTRKISFGKKVYWLLLCKSMKGVIAVMGYPQLIVKEKSIKSVEHIKMDSNKLLTVSNIFIL
jgi:hypothetical protein